MPDRSPATDRRPREDAADGDYFAPLTQGPYVLLTTDRPKGAPVSVRVPGIADGDRAYVRVGSRSGTARHLRRAGLVQVTACNALGLVSYGEPRYAAVRPLTKDEAERVAGLLAARYPSRWRFLPGAQVYFQLLVP